MEISLTEILTGLASILALYFTYNQYTKNKMTDLKVEKMKKDEVEKAAQHSEYVASIYGDMWELLHELGCDRVFIIQPHPLTNNQYISVSLEIKRKGLNKIKECIQSYPMEELALFSGKISQNDWLIYQNVDVDLKDKKARAIFCNKGIRSLAIRKMTDDRDKWVGNLFVGHNRKTDMNIDYLKAEMIKAADKIQYILPEYKTVK